MACERNKRRSEKFFINGGPVIGSCKTPLTQNALSYFSERRSQKSTLLAICSDTPVQLQSDECVLISNNVAISFLTVEILSNEDV